MLFRTILLRPFSILSLPITALSLLLLGGEVTIAQPIIPANDGTGTIVSPDGNTFNIGGGSLSADQANLFHSFQQFGLNPDQIANFLSQPHIRNILGRVIGGNPSIIQGLIRVSGGTSNLYLMNPAGIVFGPTAQLDVPANFTATTATSIQFDREFLNAIGSNNYSALSGDPNAYVFSSQTGDIINAGELKLEPGKVLTLIANTVTNTGEISTEGGQVILASMPEPGVVRLSQPGQVLSVEYQVGDTASVPTGEPISVADLSEVLNQAQDYDLGFTLNPDGSVQLSVSPLKIAPNPGTTIASGTIDVSGATGGQVDVLGETVAVVGAKIDASGTRGGGVVHIGGDFQGQGTTPTAQRTVVDSTSVIRVDAVDQGNGGEAIVWADQTTIFNGQITAQGGATAGNGGFVEVSGKQNLALHGSIDASAPQGTPGSILLDPQDINIVPNTSIPPSFTSGANDSEVSSDGTVLFADGGTTTDFQISDAALTGFSGNILLQANRDITAETGTNLNFTTSNQSVTFSANRNITLNSPLVTNGGDITLQAGQSLTTQSIDALRDGVIALTATNGDITINGSILTNADVTLRAGQNLITQTINTHGGIVTLQAEQNLTAGAIDTQGNGLFIRNGDTGQLVGVISSAVEGNGGGLIIFSDINGNGLFDPVDNVTSFTNPAPVSSGAVTLTTTSGNITLNGGINTSNASDGAFSTGDITLTSGGTIDASGEASFTLNNDVNNLSEEYTLNTSSDNGVGGNVTLTAVGDITLGLIDTSGSLGGGNISMTSTGGNINAIVSSV
ncbi:MAG: filamentous hemagglutinin N-terminal domain-containing protein, partial [Prochlorotrichaceae cyanobacterium]